MSNSFEEFKKAFEDLQIDSSCIDGSCETDELIDYPSYTDALYAKLMPPSQSGIYISRWDLKEIAFEAGDDMAIHPRRRMFELLMKFAISRENMQKLLDSFEKHMNEKIGIYEELMATFPASAPIFEEKIQKAKKTMELFPRILDEYFGPNPLA